MKVIEARNVHQALAIGISDLLTHGVHRESRNGPVLQMPTPVTTVYRQPTERVVFWSQRDANPFFHLYESLWMLSGRDDVKGVARFAKQMAEYSDDGIRFHGAYGHRWRNAFDPMDQLEEIADALVKNRNDRRQVLQMWDAGTDLGREGKDLPCNVIATFQVNTEGALDLSVFCRSNDIIWGAYGANAVHFSMLLEYMSAWVGVPVGHYYQTSVNYHAYLTTLEPVQVLAHSSWSRSDPYVQGLCEPLRLVRSTISDFDNDMHELLTNVDTDFAGERNTFAYDPFFHTAYGMFYAHHLWRTLPAPARFEQSLAVLDNYPVNVDWIRAGKEWIQRRKVRYENSLQA